MAALSSPVAFHFQEILADIAQSHGFTEYNIKCSDNLSADGYIGIIKKVQIASKNKTMCLVIKSCDSNNKIRNILPITKIFAREIYMYETVFPKFHEFENEHGLEAAQFEAKFYKGYVGQQCDALVLEDLKESGYDLHDRRSLLDQNHMTLAIKQYARLHAISFAFQNQHPLKFKALVEPMMDNLHVQFFEKSGIIKVFVKQMKGATERLDAELIQEKEVYKKFLGEADKLLPHLFSMVDEYSVVLHGDCWKNNIMFKYHDKDDPSKPTALRFIDFQISKVGSPMHDIVNFFYACASREVMDNFEAYLDIYYETLSHILRKLGSDPQKIYPFTVMKQHWKELARIGLVVRISALKIVFGEEKQRKGLPEFLDAGGDVSNLLDYDIIDNQFYDLSEHALIHFAKNDFI